MHESKKKLQKPAETLPKRGRGRPAKKSLKDSPSLSANDPRIDFLKCPYGCGNSYASEQGLRIHAKNCASRGKAVSSPAPEAAAGQAAAGAPDQAAVPDQKTSDEIPVEKLAIAIASGFDYAANRMGEHWRCSESDAEFLAKAWKPVIDRLLPGVSETQRIVGMAALSSVVVIYPKWKAHNEIKRDGKGREGSTVAGGEGGQRQNYDAPPITTKSY